LRLHEPQCRVFPVTEGIPFLGFKIFPTHRRLKRAKALAFRRRFKRVLREYAAGEIELARVDAVARGWINHASHGDTDGLRRALWRECLIPARTG
jgi:hypothetical protein